MDILEFFPSFFPSPFYFPFLFTSLNTVFSFPCTLPSDLQVRRMASRRMSGQKEARSITRVTRSRSRRTVTQVPAGSRGW